MTVKFSSLIAKYFEGIKLIQRRFRSHVAAIKIRKAYFLKDMWPQQSSILSNYWGGKKGSFLNFKVSEIAEKILSVSD